MCTVSTVLVEVDRPWAAEFWKSVGYPRDEHIVRHLGILDSGTARGRSSAIQ